MNTRSRKYVNQLSFIYVTDLGSENVLIRDSKTIVNVIITSKLDNCNSLLVALPQYLPDKVQGVQNAAARLVSRKWNNDCIKPILKELYWLPVKQPITF